MRLLHVHSGNLYGGVETMMLTMVRASVGRSSTEHEFGLAFDGRIAAELRASGVAVHQVGEVRTRNPLSVRRARRHLKDLIATKRYDAVACHMPWAHAVFAPTVKRCALPLVFWMHNPANQLHWVEWLASWTRPDLVICNSLFTASTLPRLFARMAAEVLYCPVEIPQTPIDADVRTALRDEFATSHDAVVIVQVGRMEAGKGHALLIEALAKQGDPNWTCWQVGGAQQPHEVEYVEGLKRQAADLKIEDRVKFVGPRADVARVLQAADIYCQPNTLPDAFGISFIEALGARLPVVTTAMGGAIEIVDESCGILTGPNDVEELADAISLLIDDAEVRGRLGAAGPARASALSDPGAVTRGLDAILARLKQKSDMETP
ncbi:MAG: glycosyltransferase [Deltaproteobacteria bacterium]|nr:glycosyltransferase [Deltaproteobacteria bacterium]